MREQNFELRVERDHLKRQVEELHERHLAEVKEMADYVAVKLTGAAIFSARERVSPEAPDVESVARQLSKARRLTRPITVSSIIRERAEERERGNDNKPTAA